MGLLWLVFLILSMLPVAYPDLLGADMSVIDISLVDMLRKVS